MKATRWDASDDPFDMLGGLLGDCSVRQGGLWLVACFRRIWDFIPSNCRDMVALVEASLERDDYLVGHVDRTQWDELLTRAIAAVEDNGRVIPVVRRLSFPGLYASSASEIADLVAEWETGFPSVSANWPESYRVVWRREQAIHAELLREVRGNPYRLIAFDSALRTLDVNLIAQHIHDTRDFTSLPILADALQDAGCDSDELLNHLRDPNAQHVRGCWALDLVLGKS